MAAAAGHPPNPLQDARKVHIAEAPPNAIMQASPSPRAFTIGKRIFATTAFLCLMLALSGGFAISRLWNLNGISDQIVNDYIPALSIVGRVNTRQAENQLRLARMLRTTDPEARKQLQSQVATLVAANAEDLKRYEQLHLNAEEREHFQRFVEARSLYARTREQFTKLLETDPVSASSFAEEQVVPAYLAYALEGQGLMQFTEQTAEAHGQRIRDQVRSSILWLSLSAFASLLIGMALSFLCIRSIARAMKRTADALDAGAHETASAAEHVSEASHSLAKGATEQAASLEETSSALEELSGMTSRNAQHAQEAAKQSEGTRTAADAGVDDVKRMQEALNEIKASSDSIAEIIRTIDTIAFQTNILALNAAVEAARAGESGAGFAVVADEVRSLAAKSADAAKETAAKIETAVSRTSQGVKLGGDLAVRLNEIAAKSREMDQLIHDIATASHEQNQGLRQINLAVSQMDKITQANAASAEESSGASEELNGQAQAMKDLVRDLHALAGSKLGRA